MKPPAFSYRDPRTVDETLDHLAEWGDEAAVLAGGQSLIPLLNMRLARPAVVVDINHIAQLDGIVVHESGAEFQALTRATAVEHHVVLRHRIPVLGKALGFVGHPQIRNRTTVGGNLAHADPASELAAVLALLDGEVRITSKAGVRSVPWDQFFVGPFTTARRPDELVTSIWLPAPIDLQSTFVELARRHGDFAMVGAAVGVRPVDGAVAEARIALSGVSGTPARMRLAEDAITGGPIDGASLSDVRDAVQTELDPPDDIHASAEYRREVGATLICRALQHLWEAEDEP